MSVVVEFGSWEEVRALARTANLIAATRVRLQSELPGTWKDARTLPIETAAMRLETAMMQEGVER